MKPPKGIEYFHMGPWGCYVGFTQSPKAFRREMKRMKIDEPPSFVATDHANATMHSFTKDGDLTCIITMPPSKHKMAQIAALLAHEAVHIAQEFWAWIGEKEPGREAEAYFVQYIVQRCLFHVKRNRKAAAKPK